MSHPAGSCPVCKKSFKDGDDIVICPSCGAPYHRHCYNETGHCLFEAEHGPNFEYKPAGTDDTEAAKSAYSKPYVAPESVGRGIVCKNCNTVNDVRNIFCEKCGYPLHAANESQAAQGNFTPNGPPNNAPGGGFFGGMGGMGAMGGMPGVNMDGQIDDISKRDWAAYIGSSAPVYLARMDAQQRRGSKLSFMFSAFLAGPFYFAYRKMWGWAAAAFAITVVLMAPSLMELLIASGSPYMAGISVDTLATFSNIFYWLSLLFNIACGVFALTLFRRGAGKKIKALRQQHSFDGDYQSALRSTGGTSIIGVVICLVLLLALSVLISYLAGPDWMDVISQMYGL